MWPSLHPTRSNWAETLYWQPVYKWDVNFCSENKMCWILVPELGIRRIQMDELEKLKGLSDSCYINISHEVLLQSMEQHIWATLCKNISDFILPTTHPTKLNSETLNSLPLGITNTPPPSTWDWTFPD